MLIESVDEPGGREPAVPMAWMCSDFLADRLMFLGDLMAPGSTEYGAGRRALTLTLYLSCPDIEVSDLFAAYQRERWLTLTAHADDWRSWAEARLARTAARDRALGRGDPDVAMARTAWSWLRDTELLPPLLGPEPAPPGSDKDRRRRSPWIPAWHLGISLAHLAVEHFDPDAPVVRD